MKSFFRLMALMLILFVAGCGSDNANRDIPPGQSIVLTTSLGQDQLLAMQGSATVVASVKGADGKAVADGTPVNFTVSSGIITPTAFTVGGRATATYFAENSGGRVVITATSGSLAAEALINIATGPSAAIVLKSITPDRLGLKGTGVNETGTIVFSVTDSAGNPVADGQVVNFKPEQLIKDELIYPVSATTNGGEVTVNVVSGTEPGIAKVVASITLSDTVTISTEARITMGYGEPHEKGLGLSFEKLNVPGLVMSGIENTLTVSVADRYSNPVPAGTPVYFASNCGIVALADEDGIASNLTNQFGFASVKIFTGAPHPPASGLCTYIAWTRGEGATRGEPFIDVNGNGVYDAGDIYFDLDGNGIYTTAAQQSTDDTYVWQSADIRWSFTANAPVITPSSFNLESGDVVPFDILISDVNGNPLPGGASFQVTTNCTGATLTGDTSVTIPDAVNAGAGVTDFKVNLVAPATISTPVSCSMTAAVTTELSGNSQSTILGEMETAGNGSDPGSGTGTGTYAGTGDFVTAPFKLETGLVIFDMAHSGSGVFFVDLIIDDSAELVKSLVINTGEYDGSVFAQIKEKRDYRLAIEAGGDWTVNVRTE